MGCLDCDEPDADWSFTQGDGVEITPLCKVCVLVRARDAEEALSKEVEQYV